VEGWLKQRGVEPPADVDGALDRLAAAEEHWGRTLPGEPDPKALADARARTLPATSSQPATAPTSSTRADAKDTRCAPTSSTYAPRDTPCASTSSTCAASAPEPAAQEPPLTQGASPARLEPTRRRHGREDRTARAGRRRGPLSG
jgi:hypothetical protein